jgi:tetratricopeptide (TPR) repeat protein
MATDLPEEARDALRAVMQSHAGGDVDAALAAVQEIIERWPDYAQARSYYGQTLVTRKRRFAEGLAELDSAVALGDDDPYILYTAGWCREFVANAIEKRRGGAHQSVPESVADLYASATVLFRRALAADPDDALIGDIEDMLTVVSNATGIPWDDGEEVTRAAPRPR